jgi:hypothetical protein
MIDQYDDRHILRSTDFGERVLEDAETEDKDNENDDGLFPNTSRTVFQDEGREGIAEMEGVPIPNDDKDKVPQNVPTPMPYLYMCSKCEKPYKRMKSMVTHQAKCGTTPSPANKDYVARRRREEGSDKHRARRDREAEATARRRHEEDSDEHRARRDRVAEATARRRHEEDSDEHRARRDREAEATARRRHEEDSDEHRARRDRVAEATARRRHEEDSDEHRARRDREAEATARRRHEEDSDEHRARRDREAGATARRRQLHEEPNDVRTSRLAKDNEATKEARRLARKNVLESCGVSASGHESDAINQDAENFHRFTMKSLRFVTCACCAREDGNGTMVQRLTVSNDEHLIAIRYMRQLHVDVAEKPWDHVRYQDLDINGLLPKKQYIGHGDRTSVEGVTYRPNDFICNKCVKALKNGAADFTKLAEDERPKDPIGMQGMSNRLLLTKYRNLLHFEYVFEDRHYYFFLFFLSMRN